jgi:hypothetical protein
MNIFVVNFDPALAAQQLPDKYSVKMPLETCQMVSIIFSEWYHNWGVIHKSDGQPYSTKKGAFRNHPCTQWAASKYENLAWLISHGWHLCNEYKYRYGKTHACEKTLKESVLIFNHKSGMSMYDWNKATDFVRAMPDELKLDDTIDTFTAYRKYVASKPWVKDNYLRDPSRKPSWV